MKTSIWNKGALLFCSALVLTACGGSNSDTALPDAGPQPGAPQPEVRAQDLRSFTALAPDAYPDSETAADGGPGFAALAGATVETDRWAGMLGDSAYRIEVPENWNGRLVMYAHGYAGEGPDLRITTPPIRRHLIENGYAWAASSYSKNFYDVLAGVEDTNALANAFVQIAAARGRTLEAPERTYIIGHSMGGHIAGAAIEAETLQTARNRYAYDGAVPMCGVMGDTELFDYFAAYQIAAQTLAGYADHSVSEFASIADDVRDELFVSFTGIPTPEGEQLRAAVKALTGGERPVFPIGFAVSALQDVVWATFGSDGTVNGILTSSIPDTQRVIYQFDDNPAQSAEEASFNASVQRLAADPDANAPRADGLRWIPKVNGQFSVPVVSMHTLGDMYVPFSMQQIYRQRAQANGSDEWLVQRAIRAPSHCDFTVREQVEAFDAMVAWAESGVTPAGDDVLDAAVVAEPTYGCTFTRNDAGPDDSPTTIATREAIAPLLASCPS